MPVTPSHAPTILHTHSASILAHLPVCRPSDQEPSTPDSMDGISLHTRAPARTPVTPDVRLYHRAVVVAQEATGAPRQAHQPTVRHSVSFAASALWTGAVDAAKPRLACRQNQMSKEQSCSCSRPAQPSSTGGCWQRCKLYLVFRSLQPPAIRPTLPAADP